MAEGENGEKTIDQILESLSATADEVAKDIRFPKKKQDSHFNSHAHATSIEQLKEVVRPVLDQSIKYSDHSSLKDSLSKMSVSGVTAPGNGGAAARSLEKNVEGAGKPKPPRNLGIMGDNRFSNLGSTRYIPESISRQTSIAEDSGLNRQTVRVQEVQKAPVAAFNSAAELMRPVLMRWIANQMPVIVEKALKNEVSEGPSAPVSRNTQVSSTSIPASPTPASSSVQNLTDFSADGVDGNSNSPTVADPRSAEGYVPQLGVVYAQDSLEQRQSVRVRQIQKPRTLMVGASEALRPILDQWVSSHMPEIVEKALQSEVASSSVDCGFSVEIENKTSIQKSPSMTSKGAPIEGSMPLAARRAVYVQATGGTQRKVTRVRQVQEPRVVSPAVSNALRPLLKHWLAENMSKGNVVKD